MIILIEPVFMGSCETSYVERVGNFLTVAINVIDNWCKLGILTHLSTYECYVYVFWGENFDGYPSFVNL